MFVRYPSSWQKKKFVSPVSEAVKPRSGKVSPCVTCLMPWYMKWQATIMSMDTARRISIRLFRLLWAALLIVRIVFAGFRYCPSALPGACMRLVRRTHRGLFAGCMNGRPTLTGKSFLLVQS